MKAAARYLGCIVLVQIALSCGDGETTERGSEVRRVAGAGAGLESVGDSLQIRFHFQADSNTRATIRRGLLNASQSLEVPPDLANPRAPAQLFEFRTAPEGASMYLLFTLQPPFSESGERHWGLSLSVLRIGTTSSQLLGLMDLKDAEYSWVQSVEDVDGDGSPEVVLCYGFEGEAEFPEIRVYQFGDDMWQQLSVDVARFEPCRSPP